MAFKKLYKMIQNPYENIDKRLTNIESILQELKDKPKDYSHVKYEVKEASKITKLGEQSIRKKIHKGDIKAERVGRKFLIPHNELYNQFQEVKSLRYKR